MGKIVVSQFVSLDGVVEDPGVMGDFKHAGWTLEIARAASAAAARASGQSTGVAEYTLRKALDTDALLLGRTTYEEFAVLWPSRDGELADRFNGIPKYVVSSTLTDPGWNNSKVLTGDVVEEVASLKRELDGEIVVPGSIRLARAVIEHDLVDELRLMVYPVMLGAGERLFGELADKKPLRLVDTMTVEDGVVILTYEPVGDAGQGQRDASEKVGPEAE
jgi:dihydrofolate reductase